MKTCPVCGNEVIGSKPSHTAKKKYCSHQCYAQARRGTGEGWADEKGYYWIRVDGRPILRHRHIMEVALGRPLRQDEIVHHINGVKGDDRRENLAIISRGDHQRHHHQRSLYRWAKSHDRCVSCGRNTVRHEARGLCLTCYRRTMEASRPPRSHKRR